MRIGSLFSGIGGLELGLEMSGLGRTVWQVEQSEFCRSVLAKHWPEVERYKDVKEVGKHNLSRVDVICGGFPCQDISSAGKGKGLAGERSGLWFEYARIISELEPSWVVIENVASGAKRWVDQVSWHLGELGYETLPIPITAEAVGAPHQRARIFIVGRLTSDTSSTRLPCRRLPLGVQEKKPIYPGDPWAKRSPCPTVRGVDDGLPGRVDRTKALGNAVVPQCAEVVGHVIQLLIAG